MNSITNDNLYESEKNILLDESNNEYDKLYESDVLKKSNQNRFHYNEQAIIADHYRFSCRATTAIFNAALKDMDILNESNMLERKKVERERLHVGQKNVNEGKCENLKLQCIGFDGKKDKTITAGIIKEEHITIVREPSSSYIDHLTPDNGTSRCIACCNSPFNI